MLQGIDKKRGAFILRYFIINSLLLLSVLLNTARGSSPIDKLLSLTEGKYVDFDNCDTQYLKEEKRGDGDMGEVYWMKELKRSIDKKDYCREAQITFGLYLYHPLIYRELGGLEKVISILDKGNYFLELQWHVRNYRELLPENEKVEYLQVKSYWHYIDKINDSGRCLNPMGYYEKNGKRYNLVEESQLSINTFRKKFPESRYLREIAESEIKVRAAHISYMNCTATEVIKQYEIKRERLRKAQHLWSAYTRLAPIVGHFSDSRGVSESIYLLAKVCWYLEGHRQSDDDQLSGSYAFLHKEDWSIKLDKLVDIMDEHYSTSPWRKELDQFLRDGGVKKPAFLKFLDKVIYQEN